MIGERIVPGADGHDFIITALAEVQCDQCWGLWYFDDETGAQTVTGQPPTACVPEARIHGHGRACDDGTDPCLQFRAEGVCAHLAAPAGCNDLNCSADHAA